MIHSFSSSIAFEIEKNRIIANQLMLLSLMQTNQNFDEDKNEGKVHEGVKKRKNVNCSHRQSQYIQNGSLFYCNP